MLLSNLDLLATAPGGVARLRELILTLAVQGKLVPQDPKDEPASELLKKIRAEKDRLIAEGKIKRDKPLAEIAGDEKPFGLPVNWEWVRLGEIGLVASSSRVHQSDWKGSGVPFYRAREIVKLSKDGHVLNDLFISEELFASLSLSGWVPEENDIMITGVGTIGIPYVVQPSDRFYFKDASVLIFKNFSRLNAQWLSMLMRSPLWIEGIHEYSMGTTVDTLTISRANIALLPLPPAAEQSRIVTRVEELMRLCDALEAKAQLQAAQHAQLVSTLLATLTESETPAQLTDNWRRIATHFDLLLDRPEAVDALEQTILQLAVRGLLVPQDPQDEPASALLKKIRAEKDKLIVEGKIKRDKPLPPIAEDEQPFALPPGWEWVRLGELFEVASSKRIHANDYVKDGVPFFRSKEIGELGRGAEITTEICISRSQFDSLKNMSGFPQENDLMLTAVGSIGNTWLVDGREFYYKDGNIAKLRGYCGISMQYLQEFIHSDFFMSQVTETVSGTAYNALTIVKLNFMQFPLPPHAEQSRIVTRVAQLRRLCADLRQRLAASQSTQAHLAEALVESVAR
jgi:type I restriction enzyme S subunit